MTKLAVSIGKLDDKEYCENLMHEELQWEGVAEDLVEAVDPFTEEQ